LRGCGLGNSEKQRRGAGIRFALTWLVSSNSQCRSSAKWPAFVLGVTLLVQQAACAASSVNRGAEFYAQGRYIDADQLFEYHEPSLPGHAPLERARYALYRGATYLALGDERGAWLWLSYGARLQATDPTLLSPAERRLLQDSLHSLSPAHAALPWELAGASSGALTVSTGQ
jgi:hypothetical protein